MESEVGCNLVGRSVYRTAEVQKFQKRLESHSLRFKAVVPDGNIFK
jgi:hypothetical protein